MRGSFFIALRRVPMFVDPMEWNLNESDYPQINLTKSHVEGLALWLEKILDLTSQYEGPWNVLIADLWPNDSVSRLIGHVQMDDVAVGYDIGYRVCAYVKGDEMVYQEGDDRGLLATWLSAAVREPKLQAKLKSVAAQNPFHIRLSQWGENPISAAIKIPF